MREFLTQVVIIECTVRGFGKSQLDFTRKIVERRVIVYGKTGRHVDKPVAEVIARLATSDERGYVFANALFERALHGR